MAQLYFYYSAMNAGKSTSLLHYFTTSLLHYFTTSVFSLQSSVFSLQSSYNYNERGMNTLIFTAEIDTRFVQGKVTFRIDLAADAILFFATDRYGEINKKIADKKFIVCLLMSVSF
ncbi:Thymidine kinase [Arsenophonus endosymbiont of Bemisia tabaci Q2]|nr:Thymidine kinase [Arsenophonus endosymbiont of Bemisia tabaci Q2]